MRVRVRVRFRVRVRVRVWVRVRVGVSAREDLVVARALVAGVAHDRVALHEVG